MTLRVAGVLCVVGMLGLPVTGSAQQPIAPGSLDAADALPQTIPIFPLQDVVLFPHSSVPLHIFEPRYREMVADALQGDGTIGMVLLQPGYEADYDGRPPVYAIGCAGTIVEAEELPDGRYLILLRGLVRFRVVREDQSRAYRLADVVPLPEALDDAGVETLGEQRMRLMELLDRQSPGAEPFGDSLSDEEFVDRLSQVLPLSPAQRQALLEADLIARAEALLEHLLSRMAVPL